MNIKHLIAFGLLLVTVTASTADTDTPTTPDGDEPSWKAGVDQHCRKCSAALKFYDGLLFRPARTLRDSLSYFVPELEASTLSASEIISTKSVEILDVISLLSQVGDSPAGILNGFDDVLHTVVAGYKGIISSLSVHIGDLTPSVIDAITDLETKLCQIIAAYKNAALLDACDNDIDYKPVLQSIQNLTNAVADVAKTRQSHCKYDSNVRDSLRILALVFDHLVVIGQATNVSIAAAMKMSNGRVSGKVIQSLAIIDPLASGLTKALKAVEKSLLKTIVDLAESLNEVLNAVFGLVNGVTTTVGTIVQSLTKTVSGTSSGVTKGLLKGVIC